MNPLTSLRLYIVNSSPFLAPSRSDKINDDSKLLTKQEIGHELVPDNIAFVISFQINF